MLKIGDFSKLAQVSVKALRYYGELGLFKPAWIDRFSGYRYYTLDQLPRLNRILALKDLGFSLQQVQQLLQDDVDAAELRGMMRMKHAELERQVQTEQARLERVAARLRQIEQEGELPEYEVVLKEVPPQHVVGVRGVIGGYGDIGHLFDELHARLRAHTVALDPAGPSFAIYYDTEYHDRGIDVEAAVPLVLPLPDTPSAVEVHNVPGAGTMACVVHPGGYGTLARAYNTLMAWIEGGGYRVTGPNRDVYLRGPESGLDEAQYITEVQFPVQRKPVSSFLRHSKEKGQMEPRIVTKPAFTVVGVKYRGKNENNEIAQMWSEFIPRIREIEHKADPDVSYGICRPADADGVFEYVAGFEVKRVGDTPEGMVSWQVPEQRYAVFTCTLPTIGEAYQHAFQTWLPQSGYERGDGPDFELYPRDFDPDTEGSELAIYIPLK
jgi:predicted transcriptional regulator YdeE/DNA-binding transcriptional MerR regulator